MKLKFRKISRKITKHFFEFLMLFLAVFLGFVAENYRENRQNEKIANQYLEQLALDIKKDITNGNNALEDWRENRLPYLDSVSFNFSEIIHDDYDKFLPILNAYESYEDFYPTISAYDQIKNLGFRFIENPVLIDSIQDYYFKMDDLKGEMHHTNLKYRNMWNTKHRLISKLKTDSLNQVQEAMEIPFTVKATFVKNDDNLLDLYYNKIRTARYGLMTNEYFLNKQVIKGTHLVKIIQDYLD